MGNDFIARLEASIEEARRKEHPDYAGITVYCDQHLGVKMCLTRTWGSIQDGDASASANPSLLWYCPKPGCIRCYEPTMFGYHCNGGNAGDRPHANPQRQLRGNHAGLPFMYIGKVGEGRRFMCPFYKCDEQGPEIAGLVVDEELPISEDPLANLRNVERKRASEMLVFQAFAAPSGLPIDDGSAASSDPPCPDIVCTISGERYRFELGQIINKEVAEKLNPNRRKQSGGFSFDQEEPFIEMINSKAKKKYRTDGAPVDLLLYFDLRLGSRIVVEGLVKKYVKLLDSLGKRGPFRRLWIFDAHTKTIVWSKP